MVADPPYTRATLAGWGHHPVQECDLYRPGDVEELERIVSSAPQASVISRGQGRSYGDAALNASRAVILGQQMDAILSFDQESGILRCQAAVTFASILDHVVPRGFFLPVTPGTKHISVGGAIAADVHGKNHHRDGTISSQLIEFRLLTGRGEILSCSRGEHPDLFWATLGGMGLTGAIIEASLQLRRVDSAYMDTHTERCKDLDDALERIEAGDRDYDYAVAWIDCLARRSALGRSVLLRANPARVDDLPSRLRARPHHAPRPRVIPVPFRLPGAVLNGFTMRAFNAAVFQAWRDRRKISDYHSYFYPLDAVGHWNRVYGRRGVLQYQLVLPKATARSGLLEVLEHTTSRRRGSFLAVLKSTGPANPAPLSFPIEGLTLALDFPNTGGDLLAMLGDLDRIVLGHGGRVYLAKDSCLAAADFRAMYPGLDEFRAVKARYDPEGRFSSSLARRLEIADPE